MMQSRLTIFLQSLALLVILGIGVFLHKYNGSKRVLKHRTADDQVMVIDTLAIINGDTVFTRADTIIDR